MQPCTSMECLSQSLPLHALGVQGRENEGLFRGPPAAHGYDTPEVRKKEDPKVGIMAKEGGKGRTIAGPPAG